MIQAAAEASSRPPARQDISWQEMFGLLPAEERDEFLLRLLQDELHLSVVLKRRLRELSTEEKVRGQ